MTNKSSENIYWHNTHLGKERLDRPTLSELKRKYRAVNSLDDTIVEQLDSALSKIPHLVVAWPNNVYSAVEKLSLLEQSKSYISNQIGFNIRPEDVIFWVAKTLTATNKKGQSALVTDIATHPQHLTKFQLRQIMVALEHPELLHTRGGLEHFNTLVSKINKKMLDGAITLSDRTFRLADYGLQVGVVGPWATQEIPRIFFPLHLDEAISRPSLQPFVDFAVTSRMSVLVPNLHSAYFRLPIAVGNAVGMSHPLYLR